MRRRQRRQTCGSGSGVEHRLAKARVASSNLVFRSNFFIKVQFFCTYPGVAQFGSVLDWGSRGRGFKSRHSDQKQKTDPCGRSFVLHAMKAGLEPSQHRTFGFCVFF